MTQHDTPEGGLIRPVFFDRQSLGAEDLNALVAYVRHERRRHNRNVIGWGVTNGLDVTQGDDPWTLRVGRGHAIAPSGTELALEMPAFFDVQPGASACLGLPDPCENPFDLTAEEKEGLSAEELDGKTLSFAGPTVADFTGFASDVLFDNPLILPFAEITGRLPTGGMVDRLRTLTLGNQTGLLAMFDMTVRFQPPVQAVHITLVRFGRFPVVRALDANGGVIGMQAGQGPAGTPFVLSFAGDAIAALDILGNNPDLLIARLEVEVTNLSRGRVYLAICPEETPACYKPGMPEHCMPPNGNMHAARMREGYRLRILCDLPERLPLPDCDTLKTWICEDDHVPPPPEDWGEDCQVIATLEVGAQGIVSIDQFTDRRRLPPAWVVAAQGECCCCGDDTPPPPTPTPSIPPSPTPSPTPTPTFFTFFTSFTAFTNPPTLIATDFIPTFFTIVPTIEPSFFFTIQPSFFETFGPSIGPTFVQTLQPSFIATMRPSFIIGGPGDFVTNDGLEFDPNRGRVLGLDELTGVGVARRETLEAINVTNLTEFIETDSVTLAETLGISEVRVAGLQEEARVKTLGTEPLFDSARGMEIGVETLPAVDAAMAAGLKEIGVDSVTKLLETDRRVIAAKTGLPLENVLKLQNQARRETFRGPA